MSDQDEEGQARIELIRLALMGKLLAKTGLEWELLANFDKIKTSGARFQCLPCEHVSDVRPKQRFSCVVVIPQGLTGSRLLKAISLEVQGITLDFHRWLGIAVEEEYQGSYPRA